MKFESREVAELVEVPERTLRYWSTIQALIPEEDAKGRPGIRRKYSFANLVQAGILRELYKHKVTTDVARDAIQKVPKEIYSSSSYCFIVIVGGRKIEVITAETLQGAKFRLFAAMFENIDVNTRKYNEREWAVMGTLGTYVASRDEASVIVPVHSLIKEMKKKIAK